MNFSLVMAEKARCSARKSPCSRNKAPYSRLWSTSCSDARFFTRSGRVRPVRGARQARQHGDQRPVAEDCDPFARREPGAGVFERLSVIELRRGDGGLDVDLASPVTRRLGEEGLVKDPQRRVGRDRLERVVMVPADQGELCRCLLYTSPSPRDCS